MEVILNKDISGLGEEGDIKKVANGYARNYLIPQKLAVPCTAGNLHNLKQKAKAIEAKKEEKRKEALSLKEKIKDVKLEMVMAAGEKGKLFGAVTNTNLQEELAKLGIQVEKRRIDIPHHTIKNLGITEVTVKLYGGDSVQFTVEINPDEESKELLEAEKKYREKAKAAEAKKAAEAPAEGEKEATEDSAAEEAETTESNDQE